MLLSSPVIVLLGFTRLNAVPLLSALGLLLLAPVFFGLKTWIKMQRAEA